MKAVMVDGPKSGEDGMKDFLGNEYNVGDKVLYAAMSGRSVTMVLAEVVEIYEAPKYGYAGYSHRELFDDEKETRVKVRPIQSSRWTQHYGSTYYVDTRTGKRLNPFADSRYNDPDIWAKLGGYYNNYGVRYPEYEPGKSVEFRGGELQPYIEMRNDGPKPVTLSVTDNIVLWQTAEKDDTQA